MFCVCIDDDILDGITEQLMMNVTRIGPSEDVSVKYFIWILYLIFLLCLCRRIDG